MPTDSPLLSNAEIRRRLRLIASTPISERNSKRSVGLNTVARRADLARWYIYQLCNDHTPSPKTAARLSAVLQSLDMPEPS